MKPLILPVKIQMETEFGTFTNVSEVYPTGSSYICDPPVMDTDRDWLVYSTDVDAFLEELETEGWDITLDEEYEDDDGEYLFTTARLGIHNLIIYEDHNGFEAFLAATEVAKALNVTHKPHRIMLFKAVCGNRRSYSF